MGDRTQPANKSLCRPAPAGPPHVAECAGRPQSSAGLNDACAASRNHGRLCEAPLGVELPPPGLGVHQESIGSSARLQALFSREPACGRRQPPLFSHMQRANSGEICWTHPAVIWSPGNLSALCNWDRS